MKKINRRDFIGKSSLGLCSAFAISQLPFSLFAQSNSTLADVPIGFQSWTIRDRLSKDFSGTLKMMAGLGYKLVEMCSPPGYAGAGFGSFVNMKAAEMRTIINDAGLQCPSCHFGFKELTDNLDDRIEWARQMGMTQMICSSFGLRNTASLDDYKAAADKMNKAAEKIKSAGMQAGYHNHEMEFAQLDGQLIYDALMSRFDPALVKMQFQTEVINLGYKAADYFKKYPGRFISSHLSDWTSDKKEVPIGQGVINWREFFTAAKTGGVKNFFVEMEMKTFEDSAKYIHTL